jgi:hypothetical protein
MGRTETEFEIVNSVLTATMDKVAKNSSQLRVYEPVIEERA